MKRFLQFLLCQLSFFGITTAGAQDLNFSQFYELPLMRNPALAGVFNGDVRVQSVFRNQWQSVTVPYRTTGLSGEVKFPVGNYYDFITVATQLTHDVAGDSKLSRTQILPVVNYHKSLNDEEDIYLSGAFIGGIVTSQFDPTGLKWDDQFVNGQYQPTNPTSQVLKSTGRNYMDIGLGLSLTAPIAAEGKFYAGFGLFHINKPSVTFDATTGNKLDQKWALNAGLSLPTSDWDKVVLYGDFFLQGGHRQFMAGGFYCYDLVQYDVEDRVTLNLGAIYRLNDAFAPSVKLEIKNWGFGMSYDVNLSKLSTASMSRGGFEFTLNYRNFINARIINSFKMKCVGGL